jgi:hypothetical protein
MAMIADLLRKAQRGDLKIAVCRRSGNDTRLQGVLALDPQGKLVYLPGGWPNTEENLRHLQETVNDRRTGTDDRVFLAALPMRLSGTYEWAFPVNDAEAERLLFASQSGPIPSEWVWYEG